MINAQVGKKLKFSIEFGQDHVSVDGDPLAFDLKNLGNNQYNILYNNRSYTFEVIDFNAKAKTVNLRINGKSATVTMQEDLDILIAKMGLDAQSSARLPDLKAPMPGLITEILVKEGDDVKTGAPLLVLQAMKMENVIKSAGQGRISKLLANVGESVEKNQLLIQF